MGVFDQHQAKLASSAIDPEVARERGYVTADTKTALHRHGFSPAQCEVMRDGAEALVVPLWNVIGDRAGAQMRPDEPRWIKGKLAKYETQSRLKMLVDVPPRVRPHLGDPARPLFVTEGPLKADSMVSAGLDAIALLGVWNWRGTNDDGGKVALADWEEIHLPGRQIYLVFDSDIMLKEEVHAALARFGAYLKLRGADVAYVYLPSPAGEKVGVDDFLAAGNTAADVVALAASELRKPPGAPSREEEVVDTFEDVPHEPGHRVLDDVVGLLDRYVAWPMVEQRDAVALWITHTYLLDVFDSTPRLALLSPEKQCGKTRVLELVELLAHRARLTVSMSPAYMYRAIEDHRPVLLVDEIDTIFGSKQKDETNQALRGLINAGFRDGATVGRMVGEGAAQVPADFAVFAPVAMAGIGDCLPDTVLDRSVVVRMRRRAPGESVHQLRRRRAIIETAPLARRVAAWCHRTAEALDGADPAMPAGITDRPADTWEPLLAVSDAAGGDWPARARAACLALNKVRADADDSSGEKLLGDIRVIFGEAATDRMFSAAIVEVLNGIEEAPWAGWHRGAGFTSRDLARLLRGFDIRSTQLRIGAESKKGYYFTDFEDAWRRYPTHTPAPPPDSETTETTETPLASHVSDVAAVSLPEGNNGSSSTSGGHVGHLWCPCDQCGQAVLLDPGPRRTGKHVWPACRLTPGCSGRHREPADPNPGELGPLDPETTF
jgi:hypothetical protein